jgi:hypothetical protein
MKPVPRAATLNPHDIFNEHFFEDEDEFQGQPLAQPAAANEQPSATVEQSSAEVDESPESPWKPYTQYASPPDLSTLTSPIYGLSDCFSDSDIEDPVLARVRQRKETAAAAKASSSKASGPSPAKSSSDSGPAPPKVRATRKVIEISDDEVDTPSRPAKIARTSSFLCFPATQQQVVNTNGIIDLTSD